MVIVIVMLLFTTMSSISVNSLEERDQIEKEEVPFKSGIGTEDDPYLIENIDDLHNIREDSDAYYLLTNDIYANETQDWNGGKGFEPIGDFYDRFDGVLDGGGHEIRGLHINRPNTGYYDGGVGLFATMGKFGTVRNLGLVDVSINGGRYYTGPIVGRNYGDLYNTYTTGEVIGDTFVGGLVGQADSREGEILESYSTASVKGGFQVGGLAGWNVGVISHSYTTGTVEGSQNVGGLVGVNHNIIENSFSTGHIKCTFRNSGGLIAHNRGTVINSFARGVVEGTSRSGSFAAWNTGTIKNCYGTGYLMGDDIVGGLVGITEKDGIVLDSFWDMQRTGREESDGGTGKTTEEMKDVVTFSDESIQGLGDAWDFVENPNDSRGNRDIWDIDEDKEINDGYPYLIWTELEMVFLRFYFEGKGTVEIEGDEVMDSRLEFIPNGTQIQIEAIPDHAWEFSHWSGDLSENIDEGEQEITITIEENKGLTANFEVEASTPGFTPVIILVSMIISIAVYRKKHV